MRRIFISLLLINAYGIKSALERMYAGIFLMSLSEAHESLTAEVSDCELNTRMIQQ